MAEATRAIVKGFNVVGDIHFCGVPIFVDVLLDSFFFEAAKEGLRHCVIPAVASAAYAGFEMICLAEAPPCVTAVLRALVRMD
jgi:hypothetical protein